MFVVKVSKQAVKAKGFHFILILDPETSVTGPTKSRPEPSGSHPELSGHCLEPYNDHCIRQENARKSGCSW